MAAVAIGGSRAFGRARPDSHRLSSHPATPAKMYDTYAYIKREVGR